MTPPYKNSRPYPTNAFIIITITIIRAAQLQPQTHARTPARADGAAAAAAAAQVSTTAPSARPHHRLSPTIVPPAHPAPASHPWMPQVTAAAPRLHRPPRGPGLRRRKARRPQPSRVAAAAMTTAEVAVVAAQVVPARPASPSRPLLAFRSTRSAARRATSVGKPAAHTPHRQGPLATFSFLFQASWHNNNSSSNNSSSSSTCRVCVQGL